MQDKLIQIITENGPIGMTEIHTLIGDNLTRRQLSYRLKKLRESTLVQVIGKNKGTKYLAFPQSQQNKIPFHNLLESYLPNITFYLNEEERQQLMEIGQTLGTLPGETYRREVHERILVDLSWASSHLEGSTYTLLDTKNLIEIQREAKGKAPQEAQMILNHKRAIEFILEGHGLRSNVLKNLHGTLMDSLLKNPGDGGRLRSYPIAIMGSTYLPLTNPHQILELFEKTISIANQIMDVYERSFFLLVHLSYLQPFGDGNKRTARLACNIPLVEKNLVPLTFMDVTREEYINATIEHYEIRDHQALKIMYIQAYYRSAARFREVEELAILPNLFRIAHREIIYNTVAEIVSENKNEALIKEKSNAFSDAEDRQQFIEIVREDLKELHEGNFMRYRITSQAYENWKFSKN